MKLDLTNYPVTDNHCHPFPEGREPAEFERNMCIGLYPVESEDMRNTVYFQMMIKELKRFFKLPENASDDEVIAARNKAAHGDREAYVQSLMEDAGYKRLLVDFGYPISQKTLKPEEITEMYDCTKGTQIHTINRIEWVANKLIKDKVSFDDFANLLVVNAKKMVEEQHLIAIKSVIAYFTGLNVKILPDAEVKVAYETFIKDQTDKAAEKIVRDYCFMKACEICTELDIPLQVHTGLGDSPDCNLLEGNPFLLYDAFNDPRGRSTKIMLIHGSYPYLEELGMLLNHYTNIFCDISSMIPYASFAGKDKIKKLFEMAPLNKVCFGTDGAGIPEHMWYGAIFGKKALADVLNDMIDEGYISYEFAKKSARNILYDNVSRIYKL